MKMGMVIDLEKCIGCRSCMVACKQHNAQPPQTWWNRVFTPGSHRHLTPPAKGVEFFLPVHCQHCENAPCEKVCPVGATYHAEDGAVLIDYERCIGCRYCMAACPYGVRQFNWEDPEKAHCARSIRRTIITAIRRITAMKAAWSIPRCGRRVSSKSAPSAPSTATRVNCRPVSAAVPARPVSSAISMIRTAR